MSNIQTTNINNLGKIEKNKNIQIGNCIFPFKYKRKEYNECVTTEKGKICATSVNDKKTLKKYGYCISKSNSNKKLKKNSNKKLTKKKIHNMNNTNQTILKNNSSNKLTMSNSKNLNEIFINALSELHDIYTRKGEPFRARAYKKAEETIVLIPSNILDYSELKGLPNIGDTILTKLKELQETGTLKLLERERNDPVQIFTKIHGIGPKKAQSIVDKNIKSISQLKENTSILNDNQKIGLKYFEDINKRIPRSIIDKYNDIFKLVIEELNDKNIIFEIVGSYRRGAKTSGDIDLVISHSKNDSSIFLKFLDLLKKKDIIVEFLTKGKIKSLTITKLEDDIARRVDFLYSPPDEYSFAVLYFTGSKAFNTVMRHRALKFGFTLNEHGFSKMEGKKKGEKMTVMDFPSEKSIFDFLQMEYKEPYERLDGSSVVSNTGTPIITKSLKIIKKTIKNSNSKKNKTKKIKKSSNTKFISMFRDKGINYLNKLTEPELINIIKDANNAYYNNNPFLSDSEFDIIKEYVERTYPKNKVVKEIGAPVIDRNKVELPYFMGSMDKIKPDTDALDKWKNTYKGPYVISAKLDGVSGLYSTEGNIEKLYTRGNGTVGQDISYFIPYLRLPRLNEKDSNPITIRGEFIINRNTFDEKYKDKFSNPRNFISGIINSKTIDSDKFADIDFVAYEIIYPEYKPHDQMKLLESININNVLYEIKNDISNEILSDILVNWRSEYQYESDGIIVSDNHIYDRINKNPEHSFAFKMVLSEQIAEAKVIDIIWNVSKDGLLKPKVQIEPIILGGATIQYATAHNAATVINNKLGIGAIIKIIRSGDVIPYIMETIVPAETIKMPDTDYQWNETKIDIELTNKSNNKDIINKNITGFFTGINVDGLSSGNITRIINAGYNTVPKIIDMTKEDFINIEGFKEKLSNKIYESIHDKIKQAKLYKIMSSSNIFGHGFGEKKMKLIMTEYPDILTSTESDIIKIDKLSSVKGMANKTSQNFVEKIPLMIQFINESNLNYKLENKTIIAKEYDTNHILYNKSIVFTGIREKNIMELLENKYSVKLSSSVSKNTFAIIAKDKNEESGKLQKAKKLNIPIFEISEFKTKYSLT